MKINVLPVGELNTNCYIIEDEASHEALVIDPGDEAGSILKLLSRHGLHLKYIVITHGHYDHVGGNLELKEKTKAPILMHQEDLFGLVVSTSPKPDRYLTESEILKVGTLEFKVIHCPGHSPGGISLYCEAEKAVFTGDTLFNGTWGRTDLPRSSEKAMVESLKRLLQLPPETTVYPGHGWSTTIGEEQRLLQELP